mmetsp:Transcript_38978/g.94330  ORF Transcript_38978/g.94330 Transcript_38978/m.94330 type:complete len:238 (+) Transcript_38978:467-1180(+)|eukprot:CAMPEP_0113483116 /NCGR_PEP_ID=MMETSP0014_2-20120614/23268_1 /TAXON_ID=2857 /ORGANISM="Nitzschia sp." /LENGTH=237 /DNA_ID=CAMNT_0000376653 /DNA_START=427 /DNA_END=1140 /DNA_ORIENTATION=- /assembly_acc=CAM_ASM_000159
MATDMCTRRLTKELTNLKKDPIKSPNITVSPNEENIREVHYVIEGSDQTPYQGGTYWGKLIFPKEYPLKPPSVMMLTPSGRFQPNRRLCLSMSDFHPESWNPMWSLSTILCGLYSFMIETAPTLGSIETSTSQKHKCAKQSLAYNCRDPTFRKLFPEYVEMYEEQVAAEKELADALKKAAGDSATSTPITTPDSAAVAVAGPLFGGADRLLNAHGAFTTLTGIFVAIVSILFAMRYF